MHKNLEELLKEIEASFKARIAQTGLSMRQFSQRAGVHENTLYNMKNPTIETLRRIEATLRDMGV